MLVLSRQKNENVVITVPGWPEITVCVVAIRGDKVRLGIEAQRQVLVHRQEVHDAIKRMPNGPTAAP